MTEKQSKKPARTPVLVSASEEARIARTVLAWLNGSGKLPVDAARYELLDAGTPNMAMSLMSGTYMTKQYVLGGYEAQLRFSLVYRLQPLDSGDQRLKADEALNELGDWAADPANLPELPGRCRARHVVQNTRARLATAYETGDEDHVIQLTLTYEVI